MTWLVLFLVLVGIYFFSDWLAALGAALLEFIMGLVALFVGTIFVLGMVSLCYIGYLLLVAGG